MTLRASEWIIVAYFAYLAGAAAVVPNIGGPQRRRAIAMASAVVIIVLTVAALGTRAIVWRDWMPLIYIVVGYRLPALLVTGMNDAFERRLLALDRRWHVTAISARAAPVVIVVLELAYLCCYLVVPIGFACVYFSDLRGELDRFWIAVLLSAFGCYGVLPWLPTRPPRAIEGASVRSTGLVRRVNLRVLGVASVQLNTFPSGHAAVSLATALAVSVHLPLAGVPLLLLALAIAVGSVVGRYHYAADALAGAALALVGFLISRSV
jgi:membrane-associated phospholipid phosphatase